MDELVVYRLALERWGKASQVDKMIEEMAELSQAQRITKA